MPFNSSTFIFFFISVCLLYHIISSTWRKYILLMASAVFIAWSSVSTLYLVLASVVFNYYIGNLLYQKKLSVVYYLGLFLNAGLILCYKCIEGFHNTGYKIDQVVIFIGVSYYSLQSIAYLVQIRRQEIIPYKNPVYLALYLMFFPKFLSGPIEQPRDFFLEIDKKDKISLNEIQYSAYRLILGFFKKMVLADRLAPMVTNIFDNDNSGASGFAILTGFYLFTLQLFFDFSAYTDIAIGVSRLFGIRISENFNRPFSAKSITEFWRRWHITLIRWITTYLYYPITFQLRNYQKYGVAIGILIIFLISALWHGIGGTFIIWCLIHACFMIIELWTNNIARWFDKCRLTKVYKILSIVYVFHVVVLANVFFRATTIRAAAQKIQELFMAKNFLPQNSIMDYVVPLAKGAMPDQIFHLKGSLILVILYFLFEKSLITFNETRKNIFIMFVLLLTIMLFGIFNESVTFIYFQF